MMPMSNGSYGVVKHLTCLRWANVLMPVNAHLSRPVRALSRQSVKGLDYTSESHFALSSSRGVPSFWRRCDFWVIVERA